MIILENYYFDVLEETRQDKVFVLIIYDIVSNSKRAKLAAKLQGYGFRVQKSAFEATITRKKYEKLVAELRQFVHPEDSIRIYKIVGKGQLTVLGKDNDYTQEDIIVF